MQMVGPAFMDYAMNGRVGRPDRQPPSARRRARRTASSRARARTAGSASPSLTDDEWQGLVRAMGAPAWATRRALRDARRPPRRASTRIHEQLAAWTAGFDDYELAAPPAGAGVAAAPVLNVADLLRDPHYRARGTFIEVAAPARLPRDHLRRLREDQPEPRSRSAPGPRIGQDNERVFREPARPRSRRIPPPAGRAGDSIESARIGKGTTSLAALELRRALLGERARALLRVLRGEDARAERLLEHEARLEPERAHRDLLGRPHRERAVLADRLGPLDRASASARSAGTTAFTSPTS